LKNWKETRVDLLNNLIKFENKLSVYEIFTKNQNNKNLILKKEVRKERNDKNEKNEKNEKYEKNEKNEKIKVEKVKDKVDKIEKKKK